MSAVAQTSRLGGTIAGTVTDVSGAPIAGAQVQLEEFGTNQLRKLQTNEQGIFRVSDLPIGTYEVRCTYAGFTPYLHVGLIVELGTTAPLDIVLRPASVNQQVTVSAQPSIIDASQTFETFHMNYETVEETPLRTRNYLDFTLLAPGVSSSTQPQLSVGQTPLADSGFTFGGLRARSNTLTIDGLDNNDEYAGASRTALSIEIVSEFQVINNGMSAESGGASGGAINIVSKSGTNFIHGDIFTFAQNGIFNARPFLQNGSGSPDMGRYRGGLSLGGPIVKSRTFFSTAFEQESSHIQMGSDIEPSVASALNTFLNTGAFGRLPVRNITTGFSPTAGAETEASAKLDHQITKNDTFSLRYSFRNRREAGNSFNNDGLADASAWGSSFISDHDLAGALVIPVGAQSVNDLRFQVATRRAVLRTNTVVGPEIDIAGLIQFGSPYGGNIERRENHYQGSYSFTTTHGRHSWKMGATVNHVGLRATEPGFGGVYLFNTLSDLSSGRPDSYRQAFGDPRLDLVVTNYGTFVQDHWSIGQGLTLDLGARYDFEHLPQQFNQDTNNFSPRVGLAYSPSKRWVFRAGYGTFFDRYVLAYLSRAVDEDGRSAFEQIAYGTMAATLFQGASGGSLLLPAAAISPSIFRADPNLATPYSQQSSLGVTYLIEKSTTLGVNYLFVHGVKLPRTRNVNLLPPVQLTLQNAASLGIPNPTPQQIGREVFTTGRINPTFDNMYQLEDSASSTYHGLSLSLSRRLAELSFSANYTFSKTIDDASDFDEQPQNPFLTQAERALSRNHQGHRFVLSGLWELPSSDKGLKKAFSHIELAPILTIGSGRPVDPLTGLDSDQSGAWPLSSRPLGFARNSLSTPSVASLDFRFNKTFPIREAGHLSLMADFFNMFNRRNVIQINPVFGSGLTALADISEHAGFGQPLVAQPPRQLQFAFEYEF